jgi:hypothetical protein
MRPWPKALLVYNLAPTYFQVVQACFITLVLSTTTHAITSKKMVIFVPTAVKTSNLFQYIVKLFSVSKQNFTSDFILYSWNQ